MCSRGFEFVTCANMEEVDVAKKARPQPHTPAPMAAHSYWPCLTFFLYLPTSTLLLKLLLPETPLHPLPGERVLLTGRPLWEPPLTSQDTPPSLHCPRHEGRTPWPWGWPGDWQCQGCGRQVVTMACRSLTAPPQWAPDTLGEGRVPPPQWAPDALGEGRVPTRPTWSIRFQLPSSLLPSFPKL